MGAVREKRLVGGIRGRPRTENRGVTVHVTSLSNEPVRGATTTGANPLTAAVGLPSGGGAAAAASSAALWHE